MRARSTALALVLLVACGEDPVPIDYTVVSVEARAAVHEPKDLVVTMVNEGTTRSEVLDVEGDAFPLTFSVSAPDREGDMMLSLEALDEDGLVIGRGSSGFTIGDATASVMLETTDFVINTDFVDDQYTSLSYLTHGNQVGAAADGLWTASYRGNCSDPCNVFARRFDARGVPQTTQAAAGPAAFEVNSRLIDLGGGTPATAAAGGATLVVWDYTHEVAASMYEDGVACRSFDAQGNPIPVQLTISGTQDNASSDTVAIAAMSNSNFVVMWRSLISTRVVRSAIVRPDCTAVVPARTISAGTVSTTANAVAAHPTQSKILYAWTVSGEVHIAIANNAGTLEVTDTLFLPATATEAVEALRVAPLGDGFAILVRWANTMIFDGPGRIEMYRVTSAGAVIGGAPTIVTDRSGSDFPSSEAFGTATSSSGKLFVTWHACETRGDGQGCGVFGKAFNPDGSVALDEITIPTTIQGDQECPSVAALPDDAFAVVWTDRSMQAPDTAGSAVRGRIVYLGQ